MTIPWSQATENGGPVNYAALVVLFRGLSITSPKVTPIGTSGASTGWNLGQHGISSTYSESGLSLRVQHVGPIQSWTTTIMSAATTKAIFIERLMGLPAGINPVADTYYYPAPQWSGTQGASLPVNRNGELRQLFTYSTAGGVKVIQRGTYAPGGVARKYLKFSVPSFVPAWPGHTPDLFLTSLSTNGQGQSAKAGAHNTDGTETIGTPNTLTDLKARFLEWGVATGDTVWLKKGETTYGSFAVSAVPSQTQIQFTGSSFGNGTNFIAYHVRRAAPRGECLVDQWYGAGSYLENNGGCKAVSLWQAMGPIPSGATSVTVTIPNITPGANTFNGVAGTVPDFWEGIPSDPRWNNAWYHPPKLTWSFSVLNMNSAAASLGGLGARLNWDNMNFWAADFAVIHLGADSVQVYQNFQQ